MIGEGAMYRIQEAITRMISSLWPNLFQDLGALLGNLSI
jgi:hypothetical protein